MIRKAFVEGNGGKVARITFTLPDGPGIGSIHLVGDFNDWSHTSHPFKGNGEGKQTLTLDLNVGRAYQFRYLRNDQEWMNDSQADAYVYNPNGTYNFLVITDPDFRRYDGA
jgi:1,4-alpha-glucan branching enzyme